MRISEGRQESRIRITKARIAIDEAVQTVEGLTRAEEIKAYVEAINDIQNEIIIEEAP